MKNKNLKAWVSIGIVAILHLVGIILVIFFNQYELMRITPLLLLITAFVIFYNEDDSLLVRILTVASLFIIGFGVEYMGVSTGWPFGEYVYGKTLGYQVLNTPLMIGFNWYIVVVAASNVVSYFLKGKSSILKALLSAALLLIFDFILEPVAVYFDMWSWEGNEIPTLNYFAWFFLSFMLSEIYYVISDRSVNKVAASIFIVLTVFFVVLRIYIA